MKKLLLLIIALVCAFSFFVAPTPVVAQKLSRPLKKAMVLIKGAGQLSIADSASSVFVINNDSGVVFLHLQDGSFAPIEIHTRGGTLGAYCYPQDSTGKIGIRRYVWIKEFLQEYLSKELNAPQLQIGFELTLREKKIIKEADKIIFKEVRKITKEEKKK